MTKTKNKIIALAILMLPVAMGSCRHGATNEDRASVDARSDSLPTRMDTIIEETAVAEEPEEEYTFENAEAISDFLKNHPEGVQFADGIIPVIARCVPKYAEKLIANEYSGFLVVDKASMRVLLYDRYGHEQRAYDMACAKNYGTKHKKADSRTPEGFFSVEGKYDSTEWLFTDDNGVTSKKKGQFGPRFIRIKIPTTSQIGIHGTCSPWSIGHRASHGCIRIKNENILELVDLVEVGMPVIILPGIRDRRVNREEGYDIPYFPTAPKYAMSDSEQKLRPRSAAEIEQERLRKEAKALADSLSKVQERNSIENLKEDPESVEKKGAGNQNFTDPAPEGVESETSETTN